MRKISIFLCIFLFSANLFAQPSSEKPEIYFGTTQGISASMINFSPSVNQGMLLGYNGGLIFRHITEKNVGLQVELNFFQHGWKETDSIYSRRLNYIELPFMTHIYFGNKSRFFFNIGPNYGICGGLGFMFRIRKNVLQLDARANYSLSDIFSNNKTDFFDSSNNINFSVNLSWLWQVK